MAKAPTDIQRGAGFGFDVGGVEDTSPITGFYRVGGKRLLVLKAKAIYEITLPDDIDPKRENPNLKPMEQKVSSYGTDDDVVCKTLLTADKLFSPNFLGDTFDSECALELAFEELKDLNAMRQMLDSLNQAQDMAWAQFLEHQSRNEKATRLPSIPDIEARLETFLQKANHAVLCLERIAKLFYPEELRRRWIESLTKLSVEKYGDDSSFVCFMKSAEPMLLLVLKLRNAVEHPKQDNKLSVYDFFMNEKGEISAPAFELISSSLSTGGRNSVALAMDHIIQHLAAITEMLVVNLCAANLKPSGAFDMCVAEIPDQRRRNNVRFQYCALVSGQWVPYG